MKQHQTSEDPTETWLDPQYYNRGAYAALVRDYTASRSLTGKERLERLVKSYAALEFLIDIGVINWDGNGMKWFEHCQNVILDEIWSIRK